MAKNDLIGRSYGRLTVLEDDGTRQAGKVKWLCKFKCGNQVHIRGEHLKSDRVKSCGCLNKELKQSRFKDLTNSENEYFKILNRITSENQRIIW